MPESNNNHGGARPGAGRKPKADEIKKIELMDSIAEPKKAWEQLWKLCENGDTQAIKTWIDHRFGKAKEFKEHDLKNFPFTKIVNEFRDYGLDTSDQ